MGHTLIESKRKVSKALWKERAVFLYNGMIVERAPVGAHEVSLA